ncbi:MAG TPA: hypothetical protein VFI24_12345 [Pyrinomonadaceae bacterium]|nr:hypothetical protein [Pyrinomonadaceae bacterium]
MSIGSSLPNLYKTVCHNPHIVILGAGASLAACPNGDARGNTLPVMTNLLEATGMSSLVNNRDSKVDNFESFYSDLVTTGQNKDLISQLEERLRTYFSDLQIPDEPTVYDYLLLCLREKDVIATFNWDPLLAQAHERNLSIKRLPTILYLHGTVGIGVCRKHHMKGFPWQDCVRCGKQLTPPGLMFPVKEKDYTKDEFIANQWDLLQQYLERAYWITIFGYSAPVTDTDARSLMLKVWQSNIVKDFAQLEVIDIKPKIELKRVWRDFIVRENFGSYSSAFQTHMFTHPRRTCDAYAGATMQQRPWKDNPIPRFQTLDQMHKWISPLLEEEDKYELEKTPFSDRLVFTH